MVSETESASLSQVADKNQPSGSIQRWYRHSPRRTLQILVVSGLLVAPSILMVHFGTYLPGSLPGYHRSVASPHFEQTIHLTPMAWIGLCLLFLSLGSFLVTAVRLWKRDDYFLIRADGVEEHYDGHDSFAFWTDANEIFCEAGRFVAVLENGGRFKTRGIYREICEPEEQRALEQIRMRSRLGMIH